MTDRASRRFFTANILRPSGGAAFSSVSQKILSATACRYLILWCSSLLQSMECDDEAFTRFGHALAMFFSHQINEPPPPWMARCFVVENLRWMRGLAGGLATMEILMLKHKRRLTPYATCEFKRAYCVFRSSLNMLADRARQRREARYHMRPKAHFLGHLVWHFLPDNPRYFMNYSDEDFMQANRRAIAPGSHVKANVAEVCDPRLSPLQWRNDLKHRWVGIGKKVFSDQWQEISMSRM